MRLLFPRIRRSARPHRRVVLLSKKFVDVGSGFDNSAGGGGDVPALAIRDRFGDPILDRFGAYILSRV